MGVIIGLAMAALVGYAAVWVVLFSLYAIVGLFEWLFLL